MRNWLYLNDSKGNFERIQDGAFLSHADTSAGAAYADFDRDGDLDIFVANWGGRDQVNRFYENISSAGNWLSLRLKGHQSNAFGIGTRVELYSSGKKQNRWMFPVTGYASQNDYELHFGLGTSSSIDSLLIHWPSGIQDVHKNIAINTHFMAEEQGAVKEIN